MSEYVFEKANSSLKVIEMQKKKYSKGFKIWLSFSLLMFLILFCVAMNENLALFFYDELIKYEIGGIIIDFVNNLLSPYDNILTIYNSLWRIQPPKNMIEVKKDIVFFILLISNLINIGIASIIFQSEEK